MSDLEKWIRQKNMTTNSFAELIQCSRQVIWKVKRNIAIDPKIAKRIESHTGIKIENTSPVGRCRIHFLDNQHKVSCV